MLVGTIIISFGGSALQKIVVWRDQAHSKEGSDARGDMGVAAPLSEVFYFFFLRKFLEIRVLSLDFCEVA